MIFCQRYANLKLHRKVNL